MSAPAPPLALYHFGDVVAQFSTFLARLAAIAFLLRNDLPSQLLRRLTLVLLTASRVSHHAQLFFGEVLTAMFVAVITLVAARDRIGATQIEL